MEQTFVRRSYDPSAREFLEALCKTPHKNLPVIAEVTDDHYVMEYVTGKTLTQVMAEGAITPEKAKEWILQLLDAVELLHSFRIVHRDIKPDNIVVGEDGVLRLIDFDIARRIVTGKNRDTQYLGTAEYAALEQYGFTQTDERTDIYAIGVVYNLLLTGQFPAQSLAKGENGRIIRKCTELDSDRRYRSIRLLRRDIAGGRFTSYRIFDLIPGFRGRQPAVMILAFIFYICFFYGFAVMTATVFEENNSTFGGAVVCLSIVVYVLIFYAIVLDDSIVRITPLPIRQLWLKKTVLAVLWYLFGSVVLYIAGESDIWASLCDNPILLMLGILPEEIGIL